MVGGVDLVFEGVSSGGGPIGDAPLGLIAFMPSPSTLEVSKPAKGFGSVLGLVLGTWRGLREWVGATNLVGMF